MRTALLALICLVVWTGCKARGPETAPVTGKVTYAGKPVAEGTIKFWSKTDGTLAVSPLGADGSYRLTTHPKIDGAVLGKHDVTIRSARTVFGSAAGKTEGGGLGPSPGGGSVERVIWLVPERYDDRQASGLSAEVKPGQNAINFNLPEGN